MLDRLQETLFGDARDAPISQQFEVTVLRLDHGQPHLPPAFDAGHLGSGFKAGAGRRRPGYLQHRILVSHRGDVALRLGPPARFCYVRFPTQLEWASVKTRPRRVHCALLATANRAGSRAMTDKTPTCRSLRGSDCACRERSREPRANDQIECSRPLSNRGPDRAAIRVFSYRPLQGAACSGDEINSIWRKRCERRS